MIRATTESRAAEECDWNGSHFDGQWKEGLQSPTSASFFNASYYQELMTGTNLFFRKLHSEYSSRQGYTGFVDYFLS